MAGRTPQDIAREAVKLLATRKQAPTPDNYQNAYHEVAGTRPLRPFPLEQLRQIAGSLPSDNPAQQRLKSQFARAVDMHSWEDLKKVLMQHAGLNARANTQGPAAPVPPPPENQAILPTEVLEQMARIVSHALPAVGNDDAKILDQAQELMNYLRLEHQHPATLRKMMADFAFRLSFVAEEQGLIRSTLLSLLHLVFEHIRELSPDHPWLQEQMQALMTAAEPPLSARRLDDLHGLLKDVIHKQGEAKELSLQAQRDMKETLGTFIQRLGEMSENSNHYQSKLERCATALEQANNLTDLAPVLQETLQSTRTMALDSQRVSEELQTLQERAHQSEAEVRRLQAELDTLSAMARHDMLTGALNRKGLLEVVEKELSRANRMGANVCLALLDIDDFKRINDEHGHDTGDAALKHLADVARASLRGLDSVARYGGEEFVIVMPDTSIDEADQIITRLQRQLTIEYFMQGEERLLITFSAGVTQLNANEAPGDALKRADQAMYMAKRSGKNRVVRG